VVDTKPVSNKLSDGEKSGKGKKAGDHARNCAASPDDEKRPRKQYTKTPQGGMSDTRRVVTKKNTRIACRGNKSGPSAAHLPTGGARKDRKPRHRRARNAGKINACQGGTKKRTKGETKPKTRGLKQIRVSVCRTNGRSHREEFL